MRPVTIVVLAKYPEIFAGFRDMVPLGPPKILVRDGTAIPDPGKNWKVIQGPEKFSMAGNANLGLTAVPADHDILYVGDDVRFLDPDTIEKLQAAAYAHPSIGILSPRIQGPACNRAQTSPTSLITYTDHTIAFVCIYIKRELIKKIGYFDERFNEYGFDDDDYCRRCMLAGYKLAVTQSVTVVHEHGTSTFKRNNANVAEQTNKARDKYDAKWYSMSNVTALLKTFLRDELLYDCVRSLKEVHPDIHIHVADDGRHTTEKDEKLKQLGVEKYIKLPFNGGVAKGRNALIDGCETPYFLIGDDDFTFTEESNLRPLLKLMDITDLAGGALRYRNNISHFEATYRQAADGKITWDMVAPTNFQNYQGTPYIPLDLTYNFFIAKTEFARKVRWDEGIHCACEHDDFFLAWHRAGHKVAYCPIAIASHKLRNLPDSVEYSANRHRNVDEAYFARKWNWVWNLRKAPVQPESSTNPTSSNHFDGRTGRRFGYKIPPR